MPTTTQDAIAASTDDVHEVKKNHLTVHGAQGAPLVGRTSTLTLINTIPETAVSTSDEPLDGDFRGWLAVIGGIPSTLRNLRSDERIRYVSDLVRDSSVGASTTVDNFLDRFFAIVDVFLFREYPPVIATIPADSTTVLQGGPIGRLYDSFGPTSLMIVGTIVYVLGIMMTSISTRFYQYVLCQGLLFGLGVGMLFYPCMASVSTHFKKLQATALGIVAAGSSLGGVIYPIMFRQLFDKVGFGWAVRISGLISALCCAIAILTVTTRLPSNLRNGLCIKFSGFQDPRFVLLTLGSSFVALGLFIPFFYLADFAHDIHLSSHMSFYVLAVLNGGGFFGRIAPSWLSDTFGHYNLLFPSAFLSGLFCLTIWLFSHEIISIMIFAALYGFFSGSFVSLITPCVLRISDKKEIGTRLGTLYTVISFPSLLGGPIGGLLLKAYGSYVPMSAFAGSVIIAGSMLIFWARFRIDGNFFARV